MSEPEPKTGDTSSTPPERKKRNPSELRVAKYAGPEPPPAVEIFRLKALPGMDDLIRADDDSGPSPLIIPPGKEGEAELLLGRADPQAATALLADAGAEISDVVARGLRARAALMQGDVEKAREIIGEDRESGPMSLADAALSLAEGDTPRAARRVADASFSRPDGLAERYLMALVRVAEGDMNEAMHALAEVARASPTHAVARYQLGQLLLATGDPARAGTLFEMAWLLQPSFVAPAVALAEMLSESRQYGEALNLILQVNEAAPDALAPRILQLRVLLEVGERESALQLAIALRERVPNDSEVALLYAEALSENERAAEARAALDELVKRDRVDAALAQRARRQLARIALGERPPRASDALALLKEAAQTGGPLHGEMCIELFHVAIAVGRRAEAEEALEILSTSSDVGALISGAILARSHAMWVFARKLGEMARSHVAGTQAEAQLEGFLATLP